MLVAALVAGGISFERKGTSELPVYVTGAERMAAGAEIYRTTDHKPFTYPPFFAVPFVPWTWLPAAAHRWVWYGTNVLVLVGIAVVLHRAARRAVAEARGGVPPSLVGVWVVTAMVAARHVSAVFENQSHDLLILGLLVLAAHAWSRRQSPWAGAWIGLGAACKATPLLGIVPLALQFRFTALTLVALSLCAATFLPDLVLPRTDGGSWVFAWYETFLSGLEAGGTAEGGNAWFPHSFLNQSLSGAFTRLFVPFEGQNDFYVDSLVVDLGSGRKVATLGAQLAILGLIAWSCWRGRPGAAEPGPPLRALGEFAMVGCGMVLLSPMSSKSHFCVLLLPALFCAVHWFWFGRDKVVAALLALAFVLGTLTVKGLVGRSLGNVFLAYGSVTWTTVALMLATAHVLHWGRSPATGSSTGSATPPARTELH